MTDSVNNITVGQLRHKINKMIYFCIKNVRTVWKRQSALFRIGGQKKNQETNTSSVIYSLSAIMSDSRVCTLTILSSYADGVYLEWLRKPFRLSPRILWKCNWGKHLQMASQVRAVLSGSYAARPVMQYESYISGRD